HPCFDRTSTPRCVDDADWNVDALSDLAREEVADRGEGADMPRVGWSPAPAIQVHRRHLGPGIRNLEMSDGGIMSAGNLPLCIIRVLDRELHVRLAGGNPHVADENVVQVDVRSPAV